MPSSQALVPSLVRQLIDCDDPREGAGLAAREAMTLDVGKNSSTLHDLGELAGVLSDGVQPRKVRFMALLVVGGSDRSTLGLELLVQQGDLFQATSRATSRWRRVG